MAAALEASASDYVMLDLDRIGGVTGWQRAAGLAAAYNRQVSSHLFPEVSAHLLAATLGRHWLEYVDWAVPLLQEPLQIPNGMAIVPTAPAMVCCGTKGPSPNSSSIENMMAAEGPLVTPKLQTGQLTGAPRTAF
jgi:hypothetical protein